MTSPAGEVPGQKVCALTGAYGYLGSSLRRTLEANGWRVVALSRRTPAAPGDLAWSLDSERSIQENLRHRSVDALVHAAWDFTQYRPADIDRVNVQGSLSLFEQAQAAGVRRIVFISSISAYPGAHSLYGRAKLAVESAAHQCGGAIIRPGLVYGENSGGLFGAMEQTIAKSSVIPLIGDGSYRQYLVHEADVAAAVLSALSSESVPSGPVTVAHTTPWLFRDLIKKIAQSTDRRVHLMPVPWRVVVGGLKMAEWVGIRSGFRSDSVLGLVYPNPNPDLNSARVLGVEPRAFV